MESILILLIISIQFAIVYFAIRFLLNLENKIDKMNAQIVELFPKLEPAFKKTRKILSDTNEKLTSFSNFMRKFNIVKNILVFYSLILAIIMIKKQKGFMRIFPLCKTLFQLI